MSEVRDELVRAKYVFLDKITEQARQMSWVRAAVYSKVCCICTISLYCTIPIFKNCDKRKNAGNQLFLLFPQLFSTMLQENYTT